ncbi:AGAP010041-PA-like protein [Anopheles sinensis]|uniref:AGAP010041-PA-like protein n=1 Tax=Anopheles sinensis TaxID=74873 RepID=A0A084VD19_ANOSI|nr:AGAP010041-PA-like protein [Anopheles sinensis]
MAEVDDVPMADASSTSSTPSEQDDDGLFLDNSPWVFLPEPLFNTIFLQLQPRDLLNASQCCRRWHKLSLDDYIWKKYFQAEFNVDPSIPLKRGAESWRAEYRRLTSNVPMVLTDVLTSHSHQVLHVSFSHNGKMFATCSKDGFVILWNSAYPSTIRDSYDMRKLSWKYTQFSQFNQSDTLLLVSGVHFGSPHSTSGEIAVFTVQSKFLIRRFDGSVGIMCFKKKENRFVTNPVLLPLYMHFINSDLSIGVYVGLIDFRICSSSGQQATDEDPSEDDRRAGNPLSHYQMNQDVDSDEEPAAEAADENLRNPPANPAGARQQPPDHGEYAGPIQYVEEFRQEYEDSYYESSDDCLGDDDDDCDDEELSEGDDDLENLCPKYLIFSTGSKTYTPHQIGFKRITSVNFPRRLDPGPSLQERIALRDRQRELQNESPPMEPNWNNYDEVAGRFDKVDKLIDLHGHIIGMGLSPDHRYLYVNSRPWPKNCVIRNPLQPPAIAQEIDIHVIDLMTLKKVGKMLRAHKAYTPNTECFFIFLDVCDNYVASGAEDMHAFIWDRYYGVCLAKYQHDNVVNSVAFNPRDNEMLVTTSDDYEIKIWRSLSKAKKLGIQPVGRASEYRKNKVNRPPPQPHQYAGRSFV